MNVTILKVVHEYVYLDQTIQVSRHFEKEANRSIHLGWVAFEIYIFVI